MSATGRFGVTPVTRKSAPYGCVGLTIAIFHAEGRIQVRSAAGTSPDSPRRSRRRRPGPPPSVADNGAPASRRQRAGRGSRRPRPRQPMQARPRRDRSQQRADRTRSVPAAPEIITRLQSFVVRLEVAAGPCAARAGVGCEFMAMSARVALAYAVPVSAGVSGAGLGRSTWMCGSH